MKQVYLTTLLLITSLYGYTQTRTTSIGVQDFLEILSDHPDIRSSQEEVNFMQHEIDVAKIGPDPELTAGNVSGDISGINMPHQFFVGIDYTIETGGKRRHRIRQAKAAQEVAQAQHRVFVKEFTHNALILYQKCWIMGQRMQDFQRYDQALDGGDATDSLAALEHKIQRMENLVLAESMQLEYDHYIEQLTEIVSHKIDFALVFPSEPVWNETSAVNGPKLTEHPASALLKAETSRQYEELLLAAANAVSDITFSLGNNFITKGTNPEAPSPSYNAITATLTVPLKFSKLRSTERKYAANKMAILKSEELEDISSVKAEYEVAQREIQRLSTQIQQIQSLIQLEQKLISTYPGNHEGRNDALEKLWHLQDMRWKKFEDLSVKKATLFDPQHPDTVNFHQMTVSK